MKFHNSLIVRVLDDYTGKCVEEGLNVFIPGEKYPVVKGDGYFVFLGIWEKSIELHISHPQYREVVKTIELTDGRVPEILIRLCPGPAYRDISRITGVQGIASPNSRIWLRCMGSRYEFKLWKEYGREDGQGIYIYFPKTVQLAGKAFYIQNREEEGEMLRVAGRDFSTKWKYRLEEPLSELYPKLQTRLYPVYEAETDENGRFMVCVWEEFLQEGRGLFRFPDENGREEECRMIPGKMSRVDFRKR